MLAVIVPLVVIDDAHEPAGRQVTMAPIEQIGDEIDEPELRVLGDFDEWCVHVLWQDRK